MFLNKQLPYRHVIGLWLRSARNHTWTDWGTNLRWEAGRHLSYRILWVGFNFGDLGGCYANVHSSECKCHVIPPSPNAPLHVAHRNASTSELQFFFFHFVAAIPNHVLPCKWNHFFYCPHESPKLILVWWQWDLLLLQQTGNLRLSWTARQLSPAMQLFLIFDSILCLRVCIK